ncbi:metal-dependent hydrolase [Salinibaculum salinum]|uniref:metal-dependent hydrolase n=1 Tax=Salinibaculum salinum TaxID=3131996 RepID=UPI0030EF4BC2
MMATTHALAGLLLGALTLFVAPELAPAAMLAGFAGGLFPDLDLYGKHRKTLHFPVYYSVATVPALVLAILVPTAQSVGLATFLLAAALHSVTDIFGGGLELRPWEGTSERAVYSHYHGRWLRPRRWVTYDGSPTDLALASTFALPLLFVEWGVIDPLVTVALGISGVYTIVRKHLPDVAETLTGAIPAQVRPYVPERYL